MCNIIARPKNAPKIRENYLINSAKNNPDGFGIVAKLNGKIEVEKTLDSSKGIDIIRKLEKDNAEFLAHFRLTTHGETNLENTHPFEIRDEVFVVHNGVIPIDIVDKKMSDTFHFAQLMKKNLRSLSKRSIQRFMRKNHSFTKSSKFAFLGKSLDMLIFNKEKGKELEGVWYSNVFSLNSRFSSFSYSSYSSSAYYQNRRGYDRNHLYLGNSDFIEYIIDKCLDDSGKCLKLVSGFVQEEVLNELKDLELLNWEILNNARIDVKEEFMEKFPDYCMSLKEAYLYDFSTKIDKYHYEDDIYLKSWSDIGE